MTLVTPSSPDHDQTRADVEDALSDGNVFDPILGGTIFHTSDQGVVSYLWGTEDGFSPTDDAGRNYVNFVYYFDEGTFLNVNNEVPGGFVSTTGDVSIFAPYIGSDADRVVDTDDVLVFRSNSERGVTIQTGLGDDMVSWDGEDTLPFAAAKIVGGSGDDYLVGGQGNDMLWGDGTDVLIRTTSSGDVRYIGYYDIANKFTDTTGEGAGNDFLHDGGGNGSDDLIGGAGDDTLVATQLFDRLYGGDGNDVLLGGKDSDTVDGGAGNDVLFGGQRGAQSAQARGIAVQDILTGGEGSDLFYLDMSTSSALNGDTVTVGGFWDTYGENFVAAGAKDAMKTALRDVSKEVFTTTLGTLPGGMLISGVINGVSAVASEALINGEFTEADAAGGSSDPEESGLVITDFDPRVDVLFLPIAESVSLTAEVVSYVNSGISGNEGFALQFSGANGDVYATVFFDEAYFNAFGLTASTFTPADSSGAFLTNSGTPGLLNTIKDNAITLTDADGTPTGLTEFANASDLNLLGVDFDLTLDAGEAATVFGAFAPQVIYAPEATTTQSFIGGTDMGDVLSGNEAPVDVSNLSDNNIASFATYIRGFDGDDYIIGTAAADELYGDGGDDELFLLSTNSAGFSILSDEVAGGGAGDDIFHVGASRGFIDGGDDEEIAGDTISYRFAPSFVAASVDLSKQQSRSAFDAFTFQTAATSIELTDGVVPDSTITDASDDIREASLTLIDIENVVGTLNADLIIGDGEANQLDGAGGLDTIDGGGGDDTVFADIANDTNGDFIGPASLKGGTGTDTLDLSRATPTLTFGEELEAGETEDPAALGVSLFAATETAVFRQNTSDSQFSFSGFEAYRLTNVADVFSGSEEADTVEGMAGNDELNGNGGNDVIDPGDGRDTVYGGKGDDVVYGANLTSYSSGSTSGDQYFGDEGTDTLDFTLGGQDIEVVMTATADGEVSYLGYTPGSRANVLSFASATDFEVFNGTENDDEMMLSGTVRGETAYGNGGNDVFRRASAAETITFDGGSGNDTLLVSSGGTIFDGGEDYDVVDMSELATADGAFVWHGTTKTGGAEADGSGNAALLLDNIEHLIATDDDDTINLSILSNGRDVISEDDEYLRIEGGAGNDTIIGPNRAEGSTVGTLIEGGSGSDTITGGNTGGVISAGSKSDTITAGAGGWDIRAGTGNDTITLGSGADTVLGASGNDVIHSAPGDGVDWVNVSSGDNEFHDYFTSGLTVYVGGIGEDTIHTYVNDGLANTTVDVVHEVVYLDPDNASNTAARMPVASLDNNQPLVARLNTTPFGSSSKNREVDFNMLDLSDEIPSWVPEGWAVWVSMESSSGATHQSLFINVEELVLWTDDYTGNGAGYQDGSTRVVGSLSDAGVSLSTLTKNGGDEDFHFDGSGMTDPVRVVLNGGSGDHTYIGGRGDDILRGGGGQDVKYGGEGADTFIGTASDLASGLTIGDFSDEDSLVIEDYSGAIRWGNYRHGYAELEFDSSGDGAFDGLITLEGHFSDDENHHLVVEQIDGDTHIRVTSPVAAAQMRMRGSSEDEASYGSDARDVLLGGDGQDTLDGNDGNDWLAGGADDDLLRGENGDDRILGEAGDDFADGGNGNDRVEGGAGSDTLLGGYGDDLVDGGTGNDVIEGGFGDDDLRGKAGDDRISGGGGDDNLLGMWGDDALMGEAGDDTLSGGDGNDELRGGAGDDTLTSRSGDNVFDGGAGNDRMTAGSGVDVFAFVGTAFGSDVVERFGDEDLIRIAENSAVSRFEDLQIVQDGLATVITVQADGTNSITLDRFAAEDLTVDHFEFL